MYSDVFDSPFSRRRVSSIYKKLVKYSFTRLSAAAAQEGFRRIFLARICVLLVLESHSPFKMEVTNFYWKTICAHASILTSRT